MTALRRLSQSKKLSSALQHLVGKPGRLVLTVGPNLGGSVLIHALDKPVHVLEYVPRVVFIDTGFHFPQTIDYIAEMKATVQYLTIDIVSSQTAWPQACPPSTAKERALFYYKYKVEPFAQYLQEHECTWLLNGRYKHNQKTRGHLTETETHSDKAYTSIQPLVGWSLDDMRAYLNAAESPYNNLYDLGYTSVGETFNTHPSDVDDQIRTGRNHMECGIHNKYR
jgi:phosphoadenosine phosphosulfate reductase